MDDPEHFIRGCAFAGRAINCSDVLIRSVTWDGRCYTMSLQRLWWAEPNGHENVVAKKVGHRAGLTFTVDVQQHEYTTSAESSAAGIGVNIQQVQQKLVQSIER